MGPVLCMVLSNKSAGFPVLIATIAAAWTLPSLTAGSSSSFSMQSEQAQLAHMYHMSLVFHNMAEIAPGRISYRSEWQSKQAIVSGAICYLGKMDNTGCSRGSHSCWVRGCKRAGSSFFLQVQTIGLKPL